MGRPRAGCPTDRDVAVCRGTNGLFDHFSRTLCLAGARMTGRPPPVLDWAETSAAHRFRAGAAQCTEFIIGPAKGRTRWLIAPYGLRAKLPTTAPFRALAFRSK